MIVLDTHAWVWWVSDPERLSRHARDVIQAASEERALYISSFSVWEVALLVSRGRLRLTMEVADWVGRCEALPEFHFVPVDNRCSLRSVALKADGLGDPADRIIAATALGLGAPLVTKDRKIQAIRGLETVW